MGTEGRTCELAGFAVLAVPAISPRAADSRLVVLSRPVRRSHDAAQSHYLERGAVSRAQGKAAPLSLGRRESRSPRELDNWKVCARQESW
jgi:hypothetical protein